MKRLFKTSIALLLATIMTIPALVIPASAAGEVYTVDGTSYVFLGNGETVEADLDGDSVNETYNTYSSLTDAFAALAESGGVAAIVGTFVNPDVGSTNSEIDNKSFVDISGREHITIRGIGDSAVLKFNHTLNFKAPVTMENFTLHCRKYDDSGNNTKYVFGGGDTVFGEGFKSLGGIYYGNTNGTTEKNVKTTFDSASFNPGQYIMSGGYSSLGSAGTHGDYEFVFNKINCSQNILLGFNNTKNTIYGNINCYINGGTFTKKNIQLHAAAASGSTITGKVSVIFNNGMADGFTVAEDIDYVIKSASGGTASIKTPATASSEPVFMFTPDQGYVPAIDGVVLLANSDGEYLLAPTAAEETQTFTVTYLATSGDNASAAYYSVDGVKTAFVKAGGGAAEYNGLSVVAFDTIKSALTANTNKADATLVVIGESTQENLSYPNIYPTNLLTITGADENAVLKLSGGAHPWGNVMFENIALDCAGEFSPDGNKIIFGENVTGTLPTKLWGGGSNSPHGGNIQIHSGTWNNITAGSNVATSATSTKTQSHALAIYGGDFTNATIDLGSSCETTVPKNVIFTVGGGDFSENQTIAMSNVTEIGGIGAVIYNNGMADSTSFVLDEKFEYIINSGENGSVSYDGTQFVVTPDDGYAAIVDGALSLSNVIAVDDTKTHTVTYIKETGTAKAYEIDGVKNAYVKTGGGLFRLDADGTAYYAFSDLREAVIAASGGRVLVIGEYTGALGASWNGSGVTTISSYDDSSVLTLSAFYMWQPIKFENIKLSGNSDVFNSDSRPVIFGDGIEVVGNGLRVYGSTPVATRATDVTIKSGKYAKVVGGNVGSDAGLGITLRISGGDFTEATVNLGNESSSTLNGNALLELSGGTFTDGQSILYNKLTTNGNAVVIVSNNVDTAYNLVFSENLDYVFKVRDGGKYTVKSLGGETSAPTLVFTADTDGYAPVVNGTQVTANSAGVYEYTPELSDTTQTLEITWALDTTPRAYLIDEASTVFVSAEDTVVIGENTYYPFATLTEAVAALGGVEGKVIIASDVTNTGGDSGAFVDTAGRKAITIEGLTGEEKLTLDGTFGFKGDVTLDKFTLVFPQTKYMHGFGNTTIGKDFKVSGTAYFAPMYQLGALDRDITILAKGGTFGAFNAIGVYKAVPEGTSVTSIIDGAKVSGTFNLGYSESQTSGTNVSYVKGAVNLIINTDTVTKKTISLTESKNSSLDMADGVFTVIFNNGITGYTITDPASAIIDYIVYSGVGGEVAVSKNGTKTASPTFLLTPNDGYAPRIDGIYIEETADGYFYTPEFTGEQAAITVEWIPESEMTPRVYEIDDERYAFAKSGGGVVYYNNEASFAYADINSAIAALGTDGGNIKVFGDVKYVDGGTLDTNLFKDVVGRSKVTITGIDGTSPCVTYYKNADLEGDLEIDSIKFHRLSGSLYDTGFITKGHELILGENLVTTTDFSQNMTIHGVSGYTLTFTEPQVITVKGGTITRVLPGTTWSASTVSGDSVINIEGGAIDAVFGGSHGGQNYNSIINGDVTINISGGKVASVYSGGNSKSVLNGNVVVNVSGGTFNGTTFRHGNATDVTDNKLNGNSVYVVSGGNFSGAKLGDGASRGTTGEEIFIINNKLSGLDVMLSDKGTVIYYDPDGTVKPAFAEDGTFLGYEILCDLEGIDIVIDGEKVAKTDNNIYAVGRGEHTVLFSTLWNVEFDLGGAEGTVPDTVTEYNDTVITLTAPAASKKNHYFNGWSTDKNAEKGSLEYTVPNSSSVLYAIWTEIKPEKTENSNIENSDASRIEVTSISEEKYGTHASVAAARTAADADVNIIGDYTVAYAFSVRAFDKDGENVAEFENGISFRIPKHVLPERETGEFYRIYKVTSTGDTALMAEGTDVIPYTEDDEYLYYTDYSAGDYTVVLAAASHAEYLYEGIYNRVSGKYTLVLTFKGAEASYGSFGLKYDSTRLTLDSFTFGEEVEDAGSASVADGGFGTYYSANGIYQSTWIAKNGVSVEADTEAVTIGTFVFTAAEDFEIASSTFAGADFADTGIVLDSGTLETVYADGYYLYAPCIPSTEVYCQPINLSFDTGAVKYSVKASYVLERDAASSFYNDAETGYNNAAMIVVKNGADAVYTVSEGTDNLTSDENGKAVITVTAALGDGEYEIVFTKNGYITTKTYFTVSGADCQLGIITPVCGDIKGAYEDKCGDGTVDIDDFVRVLRAFGNDAEKKLRQVVDLDESGSVNVSDLSIIKAAMAK